MRGLGTNCRLGSLLGRFRKLTLLSWLIRSGYDQNSLRPSSLNLLWSTLSLGADRGGLTDRRRIVYLLHFA